MKKHLKIVVAALLVMACVGALLGFAACNDKKESAKITAELEQNFVYDGQVHNVVATLSHDEAELSYDPQQGFKDIGTYTVTISAPATENYNAPAPVTVTVNILDPSSIAKEELAGKLASGVTDFNISKSMGVDVGVDLSYKPSEGEGWGYKLGVKGTLDLENTDNTIFTIDLTDTLASEQKFALTYAADEDVIYVKAGENKYAVQNADLLSALVTSAPADTNVTMGTYLSMIIGVLGTNCTASADGNTYTMDFNLKETLGGALGGIVGSILPENIANAIYSIFGASDWNGFVAKLPDLSGKLEVKFADGKLSSVGMKDVTYKQGDTTASVQATVSPFSISNTAVTVSVPADKDEYTDRNLLNINAEATLSLTTNGNSYIDYKVELMSNIDIISLIKDGANENTGKAYLRISHICNDNCGAYCASKYKAAAGSILEVAYDSASNPTAVYIVAGLQNILGEDALTALGVGGLASLANLAIPDYAAITADLPGLLATAVDFPAIGETPSDPGTTDPGTGEEGTTIDINAILGALNFGTNANGEVKIDIDLATLLTTLGLDEGMLNTIGAIFGDPDNESALGGISLAFNSVGIFNADFDGFDMYNTLSKVIDSSSEAEKDFSGLIGGGSVSESVKNWEIVNLTDSNVPDMYTDLDLSMLTVYEAQTQLIGNEVYFNTEALDGTQREKVPAKIWGVSGIDWNLIGQPQNVQLLVSVPQTIANSTVTDALSSTLNLYSLFKTSVPVTITLAEASDFELVMGENFDDGNYEVLEFLSADFASAMVTYTKTAGDKSVEGSITVTNTTDLSKYFWTPYASNYSDYITIDGTGIEKNVPIAINPGTVTLTYEAYGQTFTKDITITDPFTEKTVSMSKTEATVDSSFSADLTFTLKNADSTTKTIVMKSGSRYTTSGWIAFPEDLTVATDSSQDIYLMSSGWRYNTFPGSVDQQSVETEVYFDIFGEHFVQKITLTNDETSYKVTAGTPSVNGLTATVEITITNDYAGWGKGFDGTIAVRKYFSGSDLEAEDVTVSAAPFHVENDLGGESLKITVTITAKKAGTGKFYIDLMNGDTRVAYTSSAVTMEFTDPSAEA